MKVGQLADDLRVIEAGLRPDDWVVVDAAHLAKMKLGEKIQPRRVPMRKDD